MSTAALPGPPTHPPLHQPTGRLIAFEDFAPTAVPAVRPPFVRRRGSLEQGRALEILGHAVEYLIDSGMFQTEMYESKATQDAVRILMRLSRNVFEECPEVMPISRRLRQWGRRVATRALRRPLPPPC